MANLLPLTEAICKGARPQDREYSLRDTRLPGLTLRMQPCGSRSWIIRYRINGKPVRHLLGAFPETGVKAARQIAAALRAQDAEVPSLPSTAPLFETFQMTMDAGVLSGEVCLGMVASIRPWPVVISARRNRNHPQVR